MTNHLFSKKDNYARCMNSAMYSLAMREHSRQELYNKLANKEFAKNVDLNKLLNELEENNYLNEERFTESFIRSRTLRGQGSLKIANELRLRGISSSMISQALNEAEVDWYELAAEQRIKKFGKTMPVDFKEKVRQMRFLAGRGFDSELIRNLLA